MRCHRHRSRLALFAPRSVDPSRVPPKRLGKLRKWLPGPQVSFLPTLTSRHAKLHDPIRRYVDFVSLGSPHSDRRDAAQRFGRKGIFGHVNRRLRRDLQPRIRLQSEKAGLHTRSLSAPSAREKPLELSQLPRRAREKLPVHQLRPSRWRPLTSLENRRSSDRLDRRVPSRSVVVSLMHSVKRCQRRLRVDAPVIERAADDRPF